MSLSHIPERFAGRTAIVTGAGAGIGRATALRLAQEGATVIGTDVNSSRLDDLLTAASDLKLSVVQGDVTEDATISALITAAGGHVDILANVAGIMDGFLPVDETDDATWDRVFAVNVTGPFRLTRAVLPLMVARKSGVVINVSSEAGLRGSAAGAAYTSSKHALNGLTRSIAFMYGPDGVRANAVAPGPVRTSIEAPMTSARAQARIGALMPVIIPPFAEPEQLASTIAWLASDEASNINGVILADDGGWSAV